MSYYKPLRTRYKPHQYIAPVKQHYTPTDVSKSQLTWAKHWRKSIYKIDHLYDTLNAKNRYIVYPHNPEWQAYWNAGEPIDLDNPGPRRYLDPIEFDSVEELDNWARIVARLDE